MGNHALSVCSVLGNACCFIALYRGEFAEVEHFLGILADYSSKHELEYWTLWGGCFKGAVLIEKGQREDGIALLRSGFGQLGDRPLDGRFLYLRAHFAEALGHAGNLDEAFSVVDAAIDSSNQQGQEVVLPTLFRVRGELFRLLGESTALAKSEASFRRSINLARVQGLRARELQTAISLALLSRAHGSPSDALDLLASVNSSFTEGFETTDLTSAARLLRSPR